MQEAHPIAYHQAYCINYEEGRDTALKPHTDDSDLTVNVCLGDVGSAVIHMLYS